MKPKLISDRKRSLEQKPQCINEITIQRDGKKIHFMKIRTLKHAGYRKKFTCKIGGRILVYKNFFGIKQFMRHVLNFLLLED